METLLHILLAVAHALAGAAWFGAMFYSLTVLHPRATAYFASDEEFETFIAAVSRGARWKVLAAFALLGASGVALIPLATPQPVTTRWVVLVAAKGAMFLAALAIFCHVSWRLWPARVFATPAEVPAIRRRFRRAALALIALAGANIALGVVAHVW